MLRVLLTFHLIAITWVFFRAKTLGDAWLILKKIGLKLTEIPPCSRVSLHRGSLHGLRLDRISDGVEIVDERRSIFQRLAAAPVCCAGRLVSRPSRC